MTVRILQGDCRDVLKTLPDDSVHMVCTSPPYWGLRDYGTGEWAGRDPDCDHIVGEMRRGLGLATSIKSTRGGGHKAAETADIRATSLCPKCGARRIDRQIGLEPTPAEYVETVVAIFRQVRRVLRKDGTLWLNMGDSYYSPRYPGGTGENSTINGKRTQEASQSAARKMKGSGRGHPGRCLLSHGDRTDLSPPVEPHRSARIPGLKPKDLVMMPARLALALQADGWWLRQDIIWQKPNPMPESVDDRCTRSHEYIFLLSKSRRYYYDAAAIMEPTGPDTHARAARGRSNGHKWVDGGPGNQTIAKASPSAGRQIKIPSGWDTGPGDHRHLTGRYEHRGRPPGVSPKSAANGSGILANESWHASTTAVLEMRNKRSVWTVHTAPFKGAHFATFPPALIEACILAGCPKGGTVLDPFGGAGTTGLVADRLLRNAILIELSPEYCAMADRRLRGELRDVEGEPAPTNDHGPLFAEAAK